MEVRLGGVPRVSNFGNRLTDIDMITDLDLNAARAEVRHHQKTPATDIQDDVVAALVTTVGRSNRLVGLPSWTKACPRKTRGRRL